SDPPPRPGEKLSQGLEHVGHARKVDAAEALGYRPSVVRARYGRPYRMRFVSARLTPAAQQHGLALALPQVVMASPAGDGAVLTTIPIVGKLEADSTSRSARTAPGRARPMSEPRGVRGAPPGITRPYDSL